MSASAMSARQSRVGKARKSRRGVGHGDTKRLGLTTHGDAIRKGLEYTPHNAADIATNLARCLHTAASLRSHTISVHEAT